MSAVHTVPQFSAGGVVYRQTSGRIDVVLIIPVGEKRRWQLPKGIVNKGEDPRQTAVREAREETGLDTMLEEMIDKVEYWYYGQRGSQRVRFHKIVNFYLLKFMSGDTQDHDREVEEALWVEIDQAESMLSFKTEKEIVTKAKELIQALAR